MRISSKLIAGVLGAAVVVAAVAQWSLVRIDEALSAGTAERARVLAHCTMSALDRDLSLHLETLRTLAVGARLAQLAARASGHGPDPALGTTLRRLLQQMHRPGREPPFSRLVLRDGTGHLLAASDPAGVPLEAGAGFPNALKANGVWIGPASYDPDARSSAIPVALPLRDRAGHSVGLLNATLELDTINHIVAEAIRTLTYRDAAVTLLDRYGLLLYSAHTPPPERVASPVPQVLFGSDLSRREAVRAAVNGSEGTLTETIAGSRVLSTYVHSRGDDGFAGLGWSLVIDLSPQEVFRPVHRLIHTLALVSLAALALALAVSFIGVHHIVAPLRALRDAALEVGQGRLDLHLPTRRRDEIGELSAAFERMASELRLATVSKGYVDSLLASMSDLLIVLGPNGGIEAVNPATTNLLGFSNAELVGRRFGDLIGEECFFNDAGLRELIVQGRVSSLERTCRTRSGAEVLVHFSTFVTRDATGAVQGIVLVGVDVNKRLGG